VQTGGEVNTWKLDLNPSNGKYLVYKRQASHPMHLTIHTGKLYTYVTEGVNFNKSIKGQGEEVF
jgi:hypothetical protein